MPHFMGHQRSLTASVGFGYLAPSTEVHELLSQGAWSKDVVELFYDGGWVHFKSQHELNKRAGIHYFCQRFPCSQPFVAKRFTNREACFSQLPDGFHVAVTHLGYCGMRKTWESQASLDVALEYGLQRLWQTRINLTPYQSMSLSEDGLDSRTGQRRVCLQVFQYKTK